MHISSQLVPTGAHSVHPRTRRRDNRPAYASPRVRELPVWLEPVVADSFGGLVTSHLASCAVPTTTNPRGALS